MWMPKEIDREEVRAFYERLPENQLKMMRNRVAEVCRRALDAEPAVSVVDDVMFEMGRRLLENAAARLSEITEEEWHRLISEEHDRLSVGYGVEEEPLVDAVRVRALGEYGYLFGRP
jgi:hypothetical protein